MSNQYNDYLYEKTYENLVELSVDSFIDMCEEYGMDISIIDSWIQALSYKVVEARSE